MTTTASTELGTSRKTSAAEPALERSAAVFDLTGRTALVTGAVGGLGREMVLALASAGARVAVHSLDDQPDAHELVDIVARAGGQAAVVTGDVTDWDHAASFVRAAEESLGPIEILVNNAGYMARGLITEMNLAEWRKTLSVDLDGVFIVSRHVIPGMLERGHGVIINISSQLAYKGARDFASYCAAKAGVVGLTKAMARELGPTVRVNAIAPGPIETPMTAGTFTPELTAERTADLVVRRMGTAGEVAPSVVYLASDASTFMHGQTLHLNGGGVMA